MSKKFTLPHDAATIDRLRAVISEHKKQTEEMEDELAVMLGENREAQQAEEIRKAQVMTPLMLKTLERLAKGEWIKRLYNGNFRLVDGTLHSALDKRLYARLNLAGFIRLKFNSTDSPIVISGAGREALKIAKGETP